MWNISRGLILVTLLFNIGGIFCPTQHSITAVEGENVMIDCGFLTTVSGRNLMWELEGGRDSEKLLGYFLPGDRFCGTDTTECIIHTNGSITLMNVTLDDDRQNYRCLRGNEEGYDYFSDTTLYVLPKGTNGDAAIDEVIGSIPKSYKLGGKGVIYSYEQPTCEDDRDGALITSCHPPPGLIVDKVYDHVNCSCTDSDGNSNSLSIPVNSHTELKENSVAASIAICVTILALILLITGLVLGFVWHNYQRYKVENANTENFGVFFLRSLGKGMTGGSNYSLKEHDEGQQLNLDMDDVSQRLKGKEAYCRVKSDEIAQLREMNQIEDTTISDLKQRLIEKDAYCTAKSEEIYKLKEIDLKKDMEISRLRQRLTKKETESAEKSKGIHNLVRMDQVEDLSKKIGREWKAVGRNLGLKEADLDEVQMDYKEEGHQEVAYQMLLKWKKKNARSATIRILAEALKESGRNDLHHELIAYKFETDLFMVQEMLSHLGEYIHWSRYRASTFDQEEWEEVKKSEEDNKDMELKAKREVMEEEHVKDEKEKDKEREDKDEEKNKDVELKDEQEVIDEDHLKDEKDKEKDEEDKGDVQLVDDREVTNVHHLKACKMISFHEIW